MDRIKEQAWIKTSKEFRNYLDVKEMYVHLRSHLTKPQSDSLRNVYKENDEKINELMDWMPAKGGRWFANFVNILKETKDGTGHLMIIKALKDNLYKESNEQNEISQEAVEAEITGTYISFSRVLVNNTKREA